MEMNIVRAGMLTTVQDLGRRGHRASGVPLSGAMDPFALRLANLLVGNPENAAVLECTLVGPEIEFAVDTVVAVGGASCDGLPAWKALAVKIGGRLKMGACIDGCRSYLAVAGGIDVAPVMGSRSTYLRGAIGGYKGRALHDGEWLKIGKASHLAHHSDHRKFHWHIDPRVLPPYSAAPTIRVVSGAQATEFGQALFEKEFKVSARSDRMGIRLEGATLTRANAEDLRSSAVAPGTIQVPPDGQPIVLMADAQTIGGYPQVAHVIAVDLPLLAQLRPGQSARFMSVTLAEAHRLDLAREHNFAMLREGLAEALG